MAAQKPVLVVVNAGRLDFDRGLDFSRLAEVAEVRRYDDSSPSPEAIAERAAGAAVIVTKEVPVDVDLLPPSVRLIVEAGTGYNNIGTLEKAHARGIAVANVPAYSTDAVAHLVITFVLSLSCSLTQQHRALAAGDDTAFTGALAHPHFEVGGKTLGLVGGAGTIGTAVALIAKALGMRVLVWSRTPAPSPLWEVAPSLVALLAASDFVSLHCPLTPATRHLINAEALAAMKRSAYLINTARGAIVDEAALVAALRGGALAGAALDVQDPEPPAAGSPLYSLPNVVLTPHIGWKRLETRQRLVDVVATNVKLFVEGTPQNLVTPAP